MVRPYLKAVAVALYGRLPLTCEDTPRNPLVRAPFIADRRYPVPAVSFFDKTANIAITGVPRPSATGVLLEETLKLTGLAVETPRVAHIARRNGKRRRIVTTKTLPRAVSHAKSCPDVTLTVGDGIGVRELAMVVRL